MSWTPTQSKLLNVVALVLALLALLCAAASMFAVLIGIEPFLSLFSVTSEQNVPTWYATTLLLLTACMAAALAALAPVDADPRKQRRLRRGWLIFGVLILALSLDEAAAMHEKLGAWGESIVGDASGPLHFAWIVPGAVVAVLVVIGLVQLGGQLPRPIAIQMGIGLGIFLGAAFGLEMVGGMILDSVGEGWTYVITAGFEEFLEMIGTIVIFHGAGRMLQMGRRTDGQVSFRYAVPETAGR